MAKMETATGRWAGRGGKRGRDASRRPGRGAGEWQKWRRPRAAGQAAAGNADGMPAGGRAGEPENGKNGCGHRPLGRPRREARTGCQQTAGPGSRRMAKMAAATGR
ncbi:hypothetical protein [Gehongia tenuis]|uniref:Uncharacterized protein n=1 Tax=Gehongia tenuis TaxID=2763655 RepID=A0A926HNU4_9FIRM|nr:hypothetical protein [Gehongia tenuis]MBC8530523.1 hypothetical protein [Gehongia tenuis]